MIVHHFSTYPHGGAAVAALRLHQSLQKQHTISRFFYSHAEREATNESNETYRLELQSTPSRSWLNPMIRQREKSRFRRITEGYSRHLLDRDPKLETYSAAEQLEGVKLEGFPITADLIHLHWISYMADYPNFFTALPAEKPIVWTLHDMNPFTGGCHFNSGCTRFRNGCGSCPQLNSPNPHDLSARSFETKRNALRKHNLHIVAPSQWMLDQAKRSPLWPQQTLFSKINYGINVRQFHPIDRILAKTQLGLDPAATVVGFGADNVANPRKGFASLKLAIDRCARTENGLHGLVFGNGQIKVDELAFEKTTQLGFIDNVERQVLAYAACDFFVAPSLEDNQPQMIIEAMACGLPVIGFASGGIPEMIDDGIEGLLVDQGNVSGLAKAIEWLAVNRDSRELMGRRARMRAINHHDDEQQAKMYSRIYENSLNQQTAFDRNRSRAA